jgi:glyoxylase-like metal-dependent hydrolase (beta-lactamase superfamily II)
MAQTTEIAEGIYRIETPLGIMQFQPTAFLIKNAAVLIEPGPAICIPPLHEALKRLGISKLQYIIPTHIHMDHAGGTGTLARLYPESKVLVHPRGLKHAINPSRLIDSVKMVWGDNFEDDFGPISAVPESQVKTVDDGEIIRTGDRDLQFIYTPGHAPHHIAIFDHMLKGLFCGEALGMPGYQLPTAAPMSFDLEAYLSTIDPDKCMNRAADNARALGDIVLRSLKQGEKRSEIGKAVGDYIKKHQANDIKVDAQGFETIATGYILYFEKKRKP